MESGGGVRAKPGGHLVTIDDALENEYVRATIAKVIGSPWIGFNDIAVEGTWAWTSGAAITYTNWSLESQAMRVRKRCRRCVNVTNGRNWYAYRVAYSGPYGLIELDNPGTGRTGAARRRNIS